MPALPGRRRSRPPLPPAKICVGLEGEKVQACGRCSEVEGTDGTEVEPRLDGGRVSVLHDVYRCQESARVKAGGKRVPDHRRFVVRAMEFMEYRRYAVMTQVVSNCLAWGPIPLRRLNKGLSPLGLPEPFLFENAVGFTSNVCQPWQ